jgi:hypothetical protein
MKKFYSIIILLNLILIISCGTPNDPDSIIGGDGGYKIVGKHITSGYAQDIVVQNNFAFIAQDEGGLIIFDVSNSKTPVEVSRLTQQLKGNVHKIAIKDSFVFLAADAFGMSYVNISDPRNPQDIWTNVNPKPAKGLEIMANFLFTATGNEGFQITDITNPYAPELRGKTITQGFAQNVCISPDSNYLLVACGEMGFELYDISQIGSGSGSYPMTDWIDTPGYAEDVIPHPTLPYAFIASGTGGLQIADYSDSLNIKIVGSYNTGGYAKEVFYKESKVYITTELRGLQIIDVSDVTSPIRIGTVQTEYAMGLFVEENYVYVADEIEGLIIISVP